MEWTSTKLSITQQWKLSAAPVLQSPWRCCGSAWWNQRTPSPPRRWGPRTTTSHGRGGAAALPSIWRTVQVGRGSGSPPASSVMTRGWDSALQGGKAPRRTAQGTRWGKKRRRKKKSLSWLLSMWRSRGSTLSPSQTTELLALSLRESLSTFFSSSEDHFLYWAVRYTSHKFIVLTSEAERWRLWQHRH